MHYYRIVHTTRFDINHVATHECRACVPRGAHPLTGGWRGGWMAFPSNVVYDRGMWNVIWNCRRLMPPPSPPGTVPNLVALACVACCANVCMFC